MVGSAPCFRRFKHFCVMGGRVGKCAPTKSSFALVRFTFDSIEVSHHGKWNIYRVRWLLRGSISGRLAGSERCWLFRCFRKIVAWEKREEEGHWHQNRSDTFLRVPLSLATLSRPTFAFFHRKLNFFVLFRLQNKAQSTELTMDAQKPEETDVDFQKKHHLSTSWWVNSINQSITTRRITCTTTNHQSIDRSIKGVTSE